jgi:hypothetical protein
VTATDLAQTAVPRGNPTKTGRTGSGHSGSAPRLPRGRQTVAAVIVAVVLLLLAAFVGWQAILVQAGRPPYPLDSAAISARLNHTPWSDPAVLVTGIVLVLLGLWLLILAFTPARRKLVELTEDHPDVATGIRRMDLRRALIGTAEQVDGVSKATVSIGRGSATVTVSSPLGNPEGLTDRVTARLAEQLRQLNPADPLILRVELTGKDR